MYDYFFSGNQYIRVHRDDVGAGSVDAGYPAPISNWNWPGGFGANGIDAALYSGSVCYFFRGSQYIKVSRVQTGPGTTVAGPRPISDWGWPSGFGANGIDAALWSGPVCYFFKQNTYIRVRRGDSDFGKTDAGYPKTIAAGWNWPAPFSSGIKGALPSGSRCYFFSGNQYIRVSRGIEGPGILDAGYPKPISNWNWPAGFGANGIHAALYSGGPLMAPPPQGLASNYNYFLANGGNPLTHVSVTVEFDADLTSTAGGFSIQLNCFGQQPAGSTKPTCQQYCLLVEPNDTDLWLFVDNWTGSIPTHNAQQLINWDKKLATLETASTIKAGSRINFSLLYDSSNNVTGCKFTYVDPKNHTEAVSIKLEDTYLFNTSTHPTQANMAPINCFTLNIVGDYNGNNATLSSGQGSIKYEARQLLTVLSVEPGYATMQGHTGETANTLYAGLPSTAPLGVSQIWEATPVAQLGRGVAEEPTLGLLKAIPRHVAARNPEQRKLSALPSHLDPSSTQPKDSF